MIEKADDNTIFVPGHGELLNKEAVISYRNMLQDVSAKVKTALQEKKSLTDLQSLNITAPYDKKWSTPVITGKAFVELLYKFYSSR
jgi:hypothetical protein